MVQKEVKKEKKEQEEGWPQSQIPPLLPHWPCPDSPYMRNSSLSKKSGCLSLSQSHCLMNSAARCHGDREDGCGWRRDGSWSLPKQQNKAGHLNWSVLSAWKSLKLSHWRGAVCLMAPPTLEVCFHSSHLIDWRKSWKYCCGRLQRQMYCSCKRRLKMERKVMDCNE